MELYHVVYESPSDAIVAAPAPTGAPQVHLEGGGREGEGGMGRLVEVRAGGL